jgi:hypothetical protein
VRPPGPACKARAVRRLAPVPSGTGPPFWALACGTGSGGPGGRLATARSIKWTGKRQVTAWRGGMWRCWCGVARVDGSAGGARAARAGRGALGGQPVRSDRWGCARRRQPGRIVGTEAGPGRRGLSRPLGSLQPLGGLPAQRPDARPARRLLAPLRDRLLQRQPRNPAHRRPGAPARDSGPGHRQRVPGSQGPAPAPTRSSRWPVGTVEESGSNQASTRWSATSSCWLIGPWRASAGSPGAALSKRSSIYVANQAAAGGPSGLRHNIARGEEDVEDRPHPSPAGSAGLAVDAGPLTDGVAASPPDPTPPPAPAARAPGPAPAPPRVRHLTPSSLPLPTRPRRRPGSSADARRPGSPRAPLSTSAAAVPAHSAHTLYAPGC